MWRGKDRYRLGQKALLVVVPRGRPRARRDLRLHSRMPWVHGGWALGHRRSRRGCRRAVKGMLGREGGGREQCEERGRVGVRPRVHQRCAEGGLEGG